MIIIIKITEPPPPCPPATPSMLLSPLASPSRFHASLCLPPLQLVHDDSDSSASDSDSADAASESTRTSASDNEVELDVEVYDTLSKDVTSVVPIPADDNLRIGHGVDATRAYASEVLQADAASYLHARANLDPDPLALPVELIYTIVELAAAHRRTAVSLCRVSSWVRAAVLPILYGTLVLQGNGPLPFDHLDNEEEGGGDERGEELAYDRNGDKRGLRRRFRNVRRLESPLAHVRSLWLDVPPERAPRSLDACPRLRQLALPLEAYATICNTQRWLACDPKNAPAANTVDINALQGDPSSYSNANVDVDEEECKSNLNSDLDLDLDMTQTPTPCRSFTVLGQSHPHRWAPLTSSPNGRAFLRGVTHLRILNLCLSHYIPLEYTPNLTHLCIPFFDLRISPSTLSSDLGGQSVGVGGVGDPLNSTDLASALTGSAATTSFSGLDYILSSPSLQMVVLTLNPRYWRFDELSLKGWAVRAMARDSRLYVVAETRDDATRDWEVPRRDWEEEAKAQTRTRTWMRIQTWAEGQVLTQALTKKGEGKDGCGHCSVWEKAVLVRRKFLTRLSRSWETYSGSP